MLGDCLVGRRPELTGPVKLGMGLLVPGFWQWRWGQESKAQALGGMSVSMLVVSILSWGTPLALLMFGSAFAVHLASLVDALSQRTFPGFARGVPVLSAGLLMGCGLYAPVWVLGESLAWPGAGEGAGGASYLVNRLAFRSDEPVRGDWVCYQGREGGTVGVGRVVARSGDEVEWRSDGLWVGQSRVEWLVPDKGRTESLALAVPTGFLVVAPLRSSEAEPNSAGLVMVDRQEVLGRAWAQSQPVWSRRLFF